MDPASYRAWAELLASCQKAGEGQPSARWMKVACAGRCGGSRRIQGAPAPLVPARGPAAHRAAESSIWDPSPNDLLEEHHVHLLKGLALVRRARGRRELARALGPWRSVAIAASREGTEAGPPRQCRVWALGAMPGRDGAGQLALLKLRVRQLPLQAQIGKALAAAAERERLPAADLEELCVPDYGIGGRRTAGARFWASTPSSWSSTRAGPSCAGRSSTTATRLASAPAAAKKEFAATVKEMQALARDAGKMLTAQRDRVDRLFLDRKTGTSTRGGSATSTTRSSA